MKKIIFLSLFFFINWNSNAQEKSIDLIGIKTRSNFNQEPFKSWFDTNYQEYSLDKKVLKKLKKHLKKVEIKVFMGTWCGDSKRETPHLYKLLDSINYNKKNLTLITVDRSKKTPNNLQEGFDITRVPTFIFYKKGKEIGRYVEYPRETLEKDILKIVSGKPYKHSYEN